MNIKFTKMHGLGNDFMVIDGINQKINLSPQDITQLAQRNTGVGFDQLLLIEKSQQAEVDFNYRIFNADGHEVGQCGNGARCLAAFVHYYGLSTKDRLCVATSTTRMHLQLNQDKSVSVELGIPNLLPAQIPFLAEQQAAHYQLMLEQEPAVSIHTINVGNPHAVLLVQDVNTAPVTYLGPKICHHPRFPEQTNVGFMQIVNPEQIKLRVYERGCGETQACGSGAVAAAAIGRLYYSLKEQITVSLPGGDLVIDWPTEHSPIILTGPATFVYEGQIL